MRNAFLVVALAFISFIAVTLFSNSNDNAQIFPVILLILVFLVEKHAPTGNTMRGKKEDF